MGTGVGCWDGAAVGSLVGTDVGTCVGAGNGTPLIVGVDVGVDVGACARRENDRDRDADRLVARECRGSGTKQNGAAAPSQRPRRPGRAAAPQRQRRPGREPRPRSDNFSPCEPRPRDNPAGGPRERPGGESRAARGRSWARSSGCWSDCACSRCSRRRSSTSTPWRRTRSPKRLPCRPRRPRSSRTCPGRRRTCRCPRCTCSRRGPRRRGPRRRVPRASCCPNVGLDAPRRCAGAVGLPRPLGRRGLVARHRSRRLRTALARGSKTRGAVLIT